MSNEEYIENLINEMNMFNQHLETRAGIQPNEEFLGKTVENASPSEIGKCLRLYDTAMNVIDYYIYMKKGTNCINKLYEPTQYMLFLIGNRLNDYCKMTDDYADKTIAYNEMLLDNSIEFNRALICSVLLLDDYPYENSFIQKVKKNIEHSPLRKDELELISKFSNEDIQIWKDDKLL